MFPYTIHTAPHNSTLSFHSSNEYVGHVCGIQVHIASYFPLTYAYCHQRLNSWVSNFLAKYTCCPALHRSCCLFWFCVIIYCLQCELCSFKEKWFGLCFPHNQCTMNTTGRWVMRGGWGRRAKGLCMFSGPVHSQRGTEKHNRSWKLYSICPVSSQSIATIEVWIQIKLEICLQYTSWFFLSIPEFGGYRSLSRFWCYVISNWNQLELNPQRFFVIL